MLRLPDLTDQQIRVLKIRKKMAVQEETGMIF
jgi:transcriptional regulator